MKASEVYLKAAKKINEGQEKFACHAINDETAIQQLANYFMPEPHGYSWLSPDDGMGRGTYDQFAIDFRVLALLFMHQIALDEERGRK